MTVVASSAVSEAFMPAHERSSGATEKPADPQGDDGAAIIEKRKVYDSPGQTNQGCPS